MRRSPWKAWARLALALGIGICSLALACSAAQPTPGPGVAGAAPEGDAGAEAEAPAVEPGDDEIAAAPGPSPGASSGTPVKVAAPGSWVHIAVGAFMMGSPETELERQPQEVPHSVTLTRDFIVQTTEVTQEQFEKLMGYNPTVFPQCGASCPADSLSWHEAAAYCNRLSGLERLEPCFTCDGSGRDVVCRPSPHYPKPYDCPGYRLPTEAEWEYAARAGTTSATFAGELPAGLEACDSPNATLDDIAWFCGNSAVSWGGRRSTWGAPNTGPHPVAQKRPSPWGLYDIFGNICEWCFDARADYRTGHQYNPVVTEGDMGAVRVIRGGCYSYGADILRAACRDSVGADAHSDCVGLRPVRSTL